MSVNFADYQEVFQLKVTTHLLQQYTQALQKENKAKDKQNKLLHQQISNLLQQNGILRESVDSSRVSLTKSQLIGEDTPFKSSVLTMAKSYIFDQEDSNPNTQRSTQFAKISQAHRPMSGLKVQREQAMLQNQQEAFKNQIVLFLKKVQEETEHLKNKVFELSQNKIGYLMKIDSLEESNRSLREMLKGEMSLNCGNKENIGVKHNSDRSMTTKRTHQITGEDIIQFKCNNKIVHPQNAPKKVSTSSNLHLQSEGMKEQFQPKHMNKTYSQ